jgi:hypothetical protein
VARVPRSRTSERSDGVVVSPAAPTAATEPRAPYDLHLDGRYVFPASPEHVWATMNRVEEFPSWWGWLKDYRVDGGLSPGGKLHGFVVPPVHYTFLVTINIHEVDPARHISAHLSGDLDGAASVDLRDHPDGCDLRIRWSVEMRKPSLRLASHLCKPVIVWAHDHVIDIAANRFRDAL